MTDIGNKSVDDMPLSTRARKALRVARIRNVGQLQRALTKFGGLGFIDGCGKTTESEIAEISRPYIALLKQEERNNPPGPGSIPQDVIQPSSDTILGRPLFDAERANARLHELNDLELHPRIKAALALLRWTNAEQIAEGSTSRFLGQNQIGAKAVIEVKNELARVVARAPQPPPPALPVPTILGRDFYDDEESSYAESVPLEELGLSRKWLLALQEMGISNLRQLATLKLEALWNPRSVAYAKCSKVYTSVQRALMDRPSAHLRFPTTPEGLVDLVESTLSQLDKRGRRVVMERHGLWDGEPEVLEDIASKFGVTRERIRQIQARCEKQLDKKSRRDAAAYLAVFRRKFVPALLKSREGFVTPDELIDNLIPVSTGEKAHLALGFCCDIFDAQRYLRSGLFANEQGILFGSEQELQNYEEATAAMRVCLASKCQLQAVDALAEAVTAHCQRPITAEYVRRCAVVSAQIGQDDGGLMGLRNWPFFNPRTIPSMAHRALLDLGTPSHWTHIVDRMNYLFPDRAPFDPHSVTGRICTDKTFVLVKSGTWGLANWGLQRAPFIKDFLASMVRDKGGFADKEELVSAGIVRYGFKESSLRMTLSINKHVFKMLPDGTVKLL